MLNDKVEGRAYFSRNPQTGQKDGSFYFVSFFEDSTVADYYLKYNINGNYKNDEKFGVWTYDFKRLTPRGGFSIEELNFTESASGERFQINGEFNNGELDGQWSAMKNQVEFSSIKDTSFFCSFLFDKGQLNNSFSVKNRNTSINGKVDENGFLHGEISFIMHIDDKEIVDVRTFDHGRLTQSNLKINDEQVERRFLGLESPSYTSEQYTEIAIGTDYLKMMQLSQFVSTEQLNADDLRNKSDAVLFDALQSLTHHGDLSVWPDNPSFDYPKIKVIPKPFNSDEKKYVSEIMQDFNEIQSRINKVMNDDQLEIAANADENIALYQSIYNLFANDVMPVYQSLVELLKNPALKYLDEEMLLPHFVDFKDLPNALPVEEEDTSVYFPFNTMKLDSVYSIKVINEQVNAALTYLDSLDQSLQPILEREKQRLSLTEDEAIMVDLRDSIIELYGKQSNNQYQERMQVPVKEVVDRRFSAYAQLPLNEKINRLAEINNCFHGFIDFYFLLEKLPEERKEIKALYTRTVWNPFTYTDMEEVVKERLYKAYDEILFPHLISQIEERLSCRTIDDVLSDISALFERMKSLREQDTQTIEKELRRENDPQTIAQLLELKLHLL